MFHNFSRYGEDSSDDEVDRDPSTFLNPITSFFNNVGKMLADKEKESEKCEKCEKCEESEEDVYSSDFESYDGNSSDSDLGSDSDDVSYDERKRNSLSRLIIRYYRLYQFDKFCQKYYAARVISRAFKTQVAKSRKIKQRALLNELLDIEHEKLKAVRAAKERLRSRKIHENIMTELKKSVKAREEETLKKNLEKKRDELKTMLDNEMKMWQDEEERMMNEDCHIAMMCEKEVCDKEVCDKEAREEREARERELAIMKEQEEKFLKRERRRMMERHIEDRIRRISEHENLDFNRRTRIKLKEVADRWNERHLMNQQWNKIRNEVKFVYHKKQFKPVLENLLRYQSFKDNNNKWIMVTEELRKTVNTTAPSCETNGSEIGAGTEAEAGAGARAGKGCTIM